MVGENGAGKSTFLKSVGLFIRILPGSCTEMGQSAEPESGKTFALLQDYRLYPATGGKMFAAGMQKRGRAACLGGAAKGRSGRKIKACRRAFILQ